MAGLVEKEYLEKEKKNSRNFRDAWATAEKEIGRWNLFSTLTRTQKIAIKVLADTAVHKEFSSDTRNGKQNYKSGNYKWYSLYFLLTDAIQVLKKKQNRCFESYRGTSAKFDFQNGEVSFGTFGSSALDRKRAKGFGAVSCFEIVTCESAELTEYSADKQVLIPPYEKFNVTAVKTKADSPDLWCETVYILRSSGIRSDLNCALFNKPIFA